MRHRLSARALGALAALGLPAAAQTEEATLLADDGSAGDAFGIAVAVFGRTVVVGSMFDDANGNVAGSAYAFEHVLGGWSQQAKLVGSDTAAGDAFGLSVALDANTIVVGAPNDNENGSFSGSAYVFARRGSGWLETQKLLAPDGTTSDRFGLSLAIEKNTLLVGAPLDQLAGPHSGSVYVHTLGGAGWVPTQKLVPIGHMANERFGESLAMAGDTILVGAMGDSAAGGFRTGSAYVFLPSAIGFVQAQELWASDGATLDHFGISVAIDARVVVIGAPGADQAGTDAGAAYVFEHDGTSWVERQKLLASDGRPGDAFGRAVAIDEGRIAIGAFRKLADTGGAYVFVHDGTQWVEQARLMAGGSARGDQTGRSVGLHGESLVLGAHQDDELGEDSGSATVYSLEVPFTSFCPGDGSQSPCPCGNESSHGAGRGCANSTGQGALLIGLGSSSAALDDLTLEASGLPADEIAILFVGDERLRGGTGLPMGDGLRCAGGELVRFHASAANRLGHLLYGPGLGTPNGWNAGDVRRFQLWYRDLSPLAPCGIGFNLSNALELTLTL